MVSTAFEVGDAAAQAEYRFRKASVLSEAILVISEAITHAVSQPPLGDDCQQSVLSIELTDGPVVFPVVRLTLLVNANRSCLHAEVRLGALL